MVERIEETRKDCRIWGSRKENIIVREGAKKIFFFETSQKVGVFNDAVSFRETIKNNLTFPSRGGRGSEVCGHAAKSKCLFF